MPVRDSLIKKIKEKKPIPKTMPCFGNMSHYSPEFLVYRLRGGSCPASGDYRLAAPPSHGYSLLPGTLFGVV